MLKCATSARTAPWFWLRSAQVQRGIVETAAAHGYLPSPKAVFLSRPPLQDSGQQRVQSGRYRVGRRGPTRSTVAAPWSDRHSPSAARCITMQRICTPRRGQTRRSNGLPMNNRSSEPCIGWGGAPLLRRGHRIGIASACTCKTWTIPSA
jgi:hypothetical protein